MIDFIGIGAQKSASTWLFDRLRDLDEFRLTPIKELHYFDRSPNYISPNNVEITNFNERLFFNRRWYKRFSKDIGRTIFQYPSLYDLRWVLKWHTANYSDKLYASMFPDSDLRISGEITPSYSILDVKDIKRMHAINKDIKIVFLIRDPIDRSWSHCRYMKPSVLESSNTIKEFIDGEDHSQRSDYIRTIQNYSSVFPKKNMLICFYDAIKKNPKELLIQIVDFLEGDSSKVIEINTLKSKSNVSKSLNLPTEIYDYLKVTHKDKINQLSDSLGSYATLWKEKHYNVSKSEEVEIKLSIRGSEINL